METNLILGLIIAVSVFIIYRLIVKNKKLKAEKASLFRHNEFLIDLTAQSFESVSFIGDYSFDLIHDNQFRISYFFKRVLQEGPEIITSFINSFDDVDDVEKKNRLSIYLKNKIKELPTNTLADIIFYNISKYLERIKSQGINLEKDEYQRANLIILSTIDKTKKEDFINAFEKLVTEFLSTQGKPGGTEFEEWQDGPKKELLKSEWIKIKLYLK